MNLINEIFLGYGGGYAIGWIAIGIISYVVLGKYLSKKFKVDANEVTK